MLICIENMKFSFGGIKVLDGVQLHLKAGQIYGVIGPNGAGKSSTIAAILGLYTADSGKLELFGDPVSESSIEVRRRIGVLPERAGFYPWMNARDYLAWYAELFGGLQRSIPDLLSSVGLKGVDRRPIGHFSQGMRQRLALARAMVHNPILIILDEPTNGLDPRGRREIHDLFLGLSREQGVGILLCTHLLDDVARLCDHIGIIHQGRTVFEGSLGDVIGSQSAGIKFRLRLENTPDSKTLPQGAQLYPREGGWWHLRLSPDNNPADMWKKLIECGWRIQEIRAETDELENLYIQMTQTTVDDRQKEKV